ncbi:MAG: hypothetical protein AAGF45_11775, partial [Pseudomonadota bacterium]
MSEAGASAGPIAAPPRATGQPERAGRPWLLPLIVSALFWIAVLGVWHAYSLVVPPYQLPGPLAVFARMGDFFTDWALARQLFISIGHVAAAMVIAFAVGAFLAVLPYAFPAFRILVDNRLTPFLNAFSG